MKKLLLILLLTGQCLAQSPLELYRLNIDAAEMAIIKNDYKAGIYYYEMAFENNKKTFNQDLYNASACWLKVGNWQNAKPWLLKLAKRGVDINQLTEKAFGSIEKTAEWTQFAFVYNQIYNIELTDKKEFINLKKEIDEIKKMAEELRSYSKLEFENSNFKLGNDSILNKTNRNLVVTPVSAEAKNLSIKKDSVDKLVLKKLVKYLQTEGWPREDEQKYTSLKYNQNSFYTLIEAFLGPIFSLIYGDLKMSFSLGSQPKNGENFIYNSKNINQEQFKKELAEILKEALKLGDIPALAAIRLENGYEFENLHLYNTMRVRIEKSDECPENYDKYNGKYFQNSRKNALNSEKYQAIRNKYGIESQENLSQKYLYNASINQDFIFSFNTPSSEETDFSSCYAMGEFLKTAKLLD